MCNSHDQRTMSCFAWYTFVRVSEHSYVVSIKDLSCSSNNTSNVIAINMQCDDGSDKVSMHIHVH